MAAPVSLTNLSMIITGGRRITPQGGIPASFEVFIMAKVPEFRSSTLSSAENRTVNRIIRRSWKNGRTAGWKAAFARLYSQNRIKGGSS